MNICILIPAHNEARNIARLVTQLRAKSLDVVVVDDGSADDTTRLAREAGAEVLVNVKNQGKGASLQRGFAHISSLPYDALITMDGDGQHAIDDVDVFLKLLSAGQVDIICGNRMVDHKGMPFVRLATNRIMSWLVSAICHQRIDDTQCGYRLIRTAVLRNITLSSAAFEIDSEVLIKAARKGYRIGSVPVKTIYAGEKSRIHPVRDTVRFLIYIVRELTSR
ncbi:MAG: glycosyltransferase family 2 protein [Candidatus Omnitrophica bacterium]|nr:glycosyltransferase family 2 protein [Candidatus Omnitrophota bacterium]